MKYFIVLFIIIANSLHPIVLIESKVNKKYILQSQKLIYTLEFIGDTGLFKVQGLNEEEINDFKIINKKEEIETTHRERTPLITKYKITYTLSPLRNGKLHIPELEARYYEIESGNRLIPKIEKLNQYNILVFKNWFSIIFILQWVIIILIIIFILKVIKKGAKK